MPTTRSVAKRQRQDEAHRLRNRATKSTVKTQVNKLLVAVKSGDAELASTEYKLMVKLLDTAAGKGVYHRNYVARKKSRLAKRLNSLT